MTNKDKFSKKDATVAQGEGVPNVMGDDTKVPSIEEQAQNDVKPTKDFSSIKTIDTPSSKTKTYKAAEVVIGSSNSNGSAGSLMRGVSFGGGAGNDIGKDMSATTKADNVYRSGQRMGKRLDPITRKIDFNYPEQVMVSVKQSKPLCETTEKQGYPDNYYDEHAITQKVNGGAPADPVFNRSFDIGTLDMAYFADGQYNVEKGVDYKEYEIYSYDIANRQYAASPITIKRGSYMPKDLTVTFNEHGAVGFAWSEDDLSNRDCDNSTIKLCGDASLRTVNQRELDRLNMVDKAGDPNQPKYCSLGDQVRSSTGINTILPDLDALAGDNDFMSKRKLAMALAHQINKSAKDGVRIKGPMAEMLNGNIEGTYSSAIGPISEVNGISYAFNKEAYAKGGAGLWLAINESLAKFNTKGKLLSLPTSFKNALNIANANDAELRVHDLFVRDVQHCELYSTIDRSYDPFMPVIITDKANVINPISLSDTGTVTIDKNTDAGSDNVAPIFTYHYENQHAKWNIPVYNFFVQGLHDYFVANASRMMEALNNKDASSKLYTLTIPIQSSVTSLSLWDLIVCSAIPYIVKRRQETMVDVIKYENNFGYPYSGISKIRDIDVNAANNYTFIDTESGIQTKIANPVDAIKVKFPEVFWVVGAQHYDDHVLDNGHGFVWTDTVLPHYFNQNQFKARGTNDALINSSHPSVMSYPSTRSGEELTDMDTIYGMTEEDYRLSLDRMVVYPGYNRVKTLAQITSGGSDLFKYNWSTVGTNHYEIEPAKVYKYGFVGDGVPVLPYLSTAENANDKGRCLTILDVMKTPRELGLHFVVPAGVLTPVRTNVSQTSTPDWQANYRSTSSGYLAVSGPGFTAYIYKIQGKSMQNAILQDVDYNVDRGAAYMNDFVVYQAMPDNATNDFGFTFSMSKDIKASTANHTFSLDGGSYDFVPFTLGGFGDATYDESTGVYAEQETAAISNADTHRQLTVLSLQKYFWARIQRMPFVINPFDSNTSSLAYDENAWQQGNKYDPYDYLYFFGFCGNRASDYQELTYERNRDRISLGMNYVNDPYIAKSMLLK